MAASHLGVSLHHPSSNRNDVVVPRELAYLCDRPEERTFLGLNAGAGPRPCSSCDMHIEHAGTPEAMRSRPRNTLMSLQRQFEAARCHHERRDLQRAAALEAVESSNGFVPALARMAGLSSDPHLLYRMIGFDILHVRFR